MISNNGYMRGVLEQKLYSPISFASKTGNVLIYIIFNTLILNIEFLLYQIVMYVMTFLL